MTCCITVYKPCSVPVCIPNYVPCCLSYCMPCCPMPCCPAPCPPASCPPKEEKRSMKLIPPPSESKPPRKTKKILPCYYTKPTDKRKQFIKFDEIIPKKQTSCSSV
ncbi:small proline-rich protein 2H-like [Diorhabda carinulata]|uniref:small proline-rich protein 2H-like n=1 Tax=Diorhabda carinulata TaxID=1163345 RepID=UPI0025A07C29|nr:small proline-rich protein 2H-like [Diorhabda carinulata]